MPTPKGPEAMTIGRGSRVVLQYLLLYATWIVLSGKFEFKYLMFGVLSSGLVTFMTMDLFHPKEDLGKKEAVGLRFLLVSGWRFSLYIIWLLFNIIKSNLQVAYLVLHPKMPIQPGLLRFKARLRTNLGQIILANSITLTPGTITVELNEGTYLVHALVPEAAQSLLEAQMQNKLEAIFGEREETTTEILWVHDGREIGP